MKNYKLFMSYIIVMALMFTSCSKDEESIMTQEKATLSFGAVLNDLVQSKSSTKDHLSDIPACSEDAPAYVDVVLTGATNVGTMAEPLRVTVNPNPADYDGDGVDEYFTEEDSSLELIAGNYDLEYFVVRNADMDVIWVAPTHDGPLGDWVDNALPLNFDLSSGVKKYLDVDVLCYDNRDVNEYGYLFFDIETNRAIEFCIFGNYCDENGRHFPAEYTVDVWMYADGVRGDQIYDDLGNNVAMNDNGDYATSPLCVALPDTEGMDEYYFEITIEDSDAYGNVDNRIIRSGVLNDETVRSFFDGEDNLDYYHFRTGCEEEDNVPVFQDPEADATFYQATLTELNDSDSKGLAYLRLEDNRLYTTILASGMTPNMPHPQHIHGLEGENATCPPASADQDDNGFITLGEGVPFYGPVLLGLTEEGGTFPTANSWGVYTYSQSFTLGEGETISAGAISPLEDRVIVLHGMFVEDGLLTEMDDADNDPDYIATLPVACGQIQEITPFSL